MSTKTFAATAVAFMVGLGMAAGVSASTINYTGGSASIRSSGLATPYPLTINVLDSLTIADVNASLLGLTHTWPDDLDILLQGPAGQTVVLMSDAGGALGISAINLTFDDAGGVLPDEGQLLSGTYGPVNYGASADIFSAPAPVGPYGTTLSVFNGSAANGLWSLYIRDDTAGNEGSMRQWSLQITGQPANVPEPASLALLGLGLAGIGYQRRTRAA